MGGESALTARSNRSLVVAVCQSLVLLAVSWILAHWTASGDAARFAGVESTWVGQTILVRCAVPWFLQWCALAIIFSMVACRRFAVQRRHVTLGLAIPLVVGAAWWTRISVWMWDKDVLDAFTEFLFLAVERAFGRVSFGPFLTHEFLGPLTRPITLGRIWSMQGPFFFTALASTALVIFFWMVTASWSLKGQCSLCRQFVTATLAVAIYCTPVLVRQIMHVVT